jgi:8-oxo-dGTP diphosphatase
MPQTVLAIVVRDKQMLIIKRKKDDGISWAFPGGKVESGETTEAAVIREVKEECNITCNPTRTLGTRIHPKTLVEIEYWLCEYIGGEAKITSPAEIEKIAWKSATDVLRSFKHTLFEKVKTVIEDLTLIK